MEPLQQSGASLSDACILYSRREKRLAAFYHGAALQAEIPPSCRVIDNMWYTKSRAAEKAATHRCLAIFTRLEGPMKVPGKVPEVLRRPEKMPPVAVDGLEPLAQGSDESWGEWTRWYMSRHRSPLNRAIHVAGYALLLAAPMVLLGKRWKLSLTLGGAGLACIAAGHALEGNMPTIIAEPQRLLGKPLSTLKSRLRARTEA
jgi:hypothetical protein